MVYSIVQYIFNLATDTLRLTFVFVRLCMFLSCRPSLLPSIEPPLTRGMCVRERECVCVCFSVFFPSLLSLYLSLSRSLCLSLSLAMYNRIHTLCHICQDTVGVMSYI